MPFSFLNPWFWLGALAVAAPIWLHLRRKHETNLIRFSAVRFLVDQPEARRSPWRLRNLFLFALRVLALLLVVAAFAWPYWRGANMAPVKESRVYILDNTLSHQANNGFDQDRERLLAELGRLGSDVQVAVVELTSAPRVLAAFGEQRPAAREKLRALTPSHQRGSYLAAFRQANALLANSLGEQKRIVFLGDNQQNQWEENINTPPFLRSVQVDLPTPAALSLPNLSLSEPRLQRVFLGDKTLVDFTVKLSHIGPAKTANVLLRANGQAVLNRTVPLENQPETILVQAQWEAEPNSWLKVEAAVQGTPDALPGDNRVFASLAPVVEGKVALLAHSEYLRLALSPEIMRGQWAVRMLEPGRLGPELDANQDADVLCIESDYLQASEARKLLWRYLTNGRGVFLVMNHLTPTIDGYLRELGFEPQGTTLAGAAHPEKFQFVLSNHPIFHPFLSPDYGNLMDIRVLQYVRLRATAAMPLLYSQSGAGLFFQSTRFQGKLFVTAFGFERQQTTWPLHQTFIPFLDLTLQAARAEDPAPTSFEPAEVATLSVPADAHAHAVVLRDGTHGLVRAVADQSKFQVRLPDRPGLYSVTYDDKDKVEQVLSVNPSPKESQLRFVSAPEAIQTWRFDRPSRARSGVASAATQVGRAGILQQRLWWWMLLGALLALLLEMTLPEGKKVRT